MRPRAQPLRHRSLSSQITALVQVQTGREPKGMCTFQITEGNLKASKKKRKLMFRNVTVPPSITSQCSVSSAYSSLLPSQHLVSLPPSILQPSSPPPGQDPPAPPQPSFTYRGHRPASCATPPACPPALPVLLRAALPACPAYAAPLALLTAGLPRRQAQPPCRQLCLHRPIPATGGERCSTQRAVSPVSP